MKKILALSIALVVLFSGCVGFEGFKFGVDGQTKELPSDLVVFRNSMVVPSPPIATSENFTFSVEVVNLDDINNVDITNVTLYDTGRCTLLEDGNTLKSGGMLVAGQPEYIDWKFKAPTNQQVGNLPSNCPLRYQLTYAFRAETQLDASVINYQKSVDLERANEKSSFATSEIRSRGPIKITMQHDNPNPVRTDSIMPMTLKILDKGTGLIESKDGKIQTGALFIKVPKEISDATNKQDSKICNGYFIISEDGQDYVIYKNNRAIPLTNRESPEIKCTFGTPSSNTISDERTYYFSTYLDYTYNLDGETEVSIQPTAAQQ